MKKLLIINTVIAAVIILLESEAWWGPWEFTLAFLAPLPLSFIIWLIYCSGGFGTGIDPNDRGAGTGEH